MIPVYSPQIGPDQVKKLYRLKCAILATGQKTTMTAIVREALDRYLAAKEKELKEQLAAQPVEEVIER